MTNLAKINQTLNFWILEMIEGGFLIGSDCCPAFILDDADLEFYLLQVNEIGQDDWAEVTYNDFLRADSSDIEKHINDYLSGKHLDTLEQYELSKLSAKTAPFPSADHPELHRDCQRPTFSYHKIHIKKRK